MKLYSLKNTFIKYVILVADIECKPVVYIPSILEVLKKVLPDKYHHLNPINQQALEKGREMLLTSKAAMRV